MKLEELLKQVNVVGSKERPYYVVHIFLSGEGKLMDAEVREIKMGALHSFGIEAECTQLDADAENSVGA